MNKKQLIAIFSLSAVALVLVLMTQFLWALNLYRQNKKEIEANVKNALAVSAEKTCRRSACFEMFSKAYVKAGEGFYISKITNNRQLDTLPMLFNGRGYFYDEARKKFLMRYKKMDFETPVTAEIVINFRYQDSDSFSKISQDSVFKQLNPTNYQDVFAGKADIHELYNTRFMDSTLKAELAAQSITMPYALGIIETAGRNVVFKSRPVSDAALVNSAYTNNLNGDEYFNKRYRLALVFDRSFVVGKSLWVMLLVSAFVVMLLVTLMWQFMRVLNRQRQINEMKNDFINNMTHEFNTPIANIALATESLGKSEELSRDDKTARLVSIIQEQNENIRDNVEHILKIATTEKKGLHLNKERLNVAELIRSVIYEFSLVMSEKKGVIHFTEAPQPVYIVADELYILHALQNLIDNAIKYTANPPVIAITLSVKEQNAIIAVEDNGIGIGREELKYIFDKFYRVPTGNLHQTKGFGLGLSYVHMIAKAHGGSIQVKSTKGKGSLFELQLPIAGA